MAGVPVSVQAAARSAYRSVLRAAASTFQGDEPVHKAFITKMRNDMLTASSSEQSAFAEHIKVTSEIADILKKNFVQGQRSDTGDVWRLRFTKDSELGSNETVKVPLPPKARRRRQTDSVQDEIEGRTIESANYSAKKRDSRERVVPSLNESDLEETFIRGSGPGGQAINKISNNVSLLHKPTGTRVQCQETRSLQQNRRLARRILVQKLDQLQNPGLSKEDMKWAKERERKRRQKKKQRRRSETEADDAAI